VVIKEGTNQVVRSHEEKGKRGDYFWYLAKVDQICCRKVSLLV
jgi:hypothetical protein